MTEGPKQQLLRSRWGQRSGIWSKGVNITRSRHLDPPLSEGRNQQSLEVPKVSLHSRGPRTTSATLRAHPHLQDLGSPTHITIWVWSLQQIKRPVFVWVQVSFLQPTGTRVPLKKKKSDTEYWYVLSRGVKSRRKTGHHLLTWGVSEGTFAVKMSF